MKNILQILKNLGITYTEHKHPAVFTVEEANKYYDTIPGTHTKNLFLRNKKGDKHYLVVIESSKRVDLGKLKQILGESKLSFASPERLKEHLNLTPGSVTPFGLIHDKDKKVQVIIDNDLWESEEINCHPNINTSTLTISSKDFRKFLEWTGNSVQSLDIPARDD